MTPRHALGWTAVAAWAALGLGACDAEVVGGGGGAGAGAPSDEPGGGGPGDDGGVPPLVGDGEVAAPDGDVDPDGGGPVNPPISAGKRCHLQLHWAGGSGQPDSLNGEGVTQVWPQSPDGAFWLYDGPHNMAYDPDTGDAEYQALVTYLEGVLDDRDCGPTIVLGYSNGGGLAAKLYCRGEDFGGRVWGYLMDDPVMDDGVRGCAPSPNVRKVLFTHSEELRDDAAAANHSCSVTGWYCEDNRTMSVPEYNAETGQTSVLQREMHAGGGWVDNNNAAWAVPTRWWADDF